MIKIKFGKDDGLEATFSGSRWKSDDKVVQRMLNDTLDLDEVAVSDAYREFKKAVGLDAVALEAVWHLEPELIENSPLEFASEKEGVVY